MGISLGRYELFLFDMDGTLVKFKLDFDYLKRSTRKILEDNGIYLEIKGSLIETIKELRPLFDTDEAYNNFVKGIEDTISQHEIETAEKAEVFPHSKELLDTLRLKGKKIGIITRNCKKASLRTLEVSGLIGYMDVIVTREDVINVKPHPEHVEVAINHLGKKPSETVVVGDHRYDIVSGKRAGCFTIGILSGVSSEELLKEADVVVSSLDEIISYL